MKFISATKRNLFCVCLAIFIAIWDKFLPLPLPGRTIIESDNIELKEQPGFPRAVIQPFDLLKKFAVPEPIPEVYLESADEGKYISMTKGHGGILSLSGRVHLRIRALSIFADQININTVSQEIFASGKVRLYQEEKILTGQDLYFNQKNGQGVIYQTKAFIKPFHYLGQRFRRINEELIIMDKGNMTTCDYELPHYKFKVSKVWLYGDRKIFAEDVTVTVGDSPLFALPIIYQTDEGSGIITQLGNSDRRGFFLQNTFYLNFPFKMAEEGAIQTKWMLDFYQRTGQYYSLNTLVKKKDLFWDIKLGFARFYPVDWDAELKRFRNLSAKEITESGSALQKQDWNSLKTKLDLKLLDDPWGSHSIHYDIEWYNHAYMLQFFENRWEPSTTMDMLNHLFLSESMKAIKYTLNWNASYQRKGENSIFIAALSRGWQWDTGKTFLNEQAGYLPQTDQVPDIRHQWNDVWLLGNENFSQRIQFGMNNQLVRTKNYDLFGAKIYDSWLAQGNVYANSQFFLWNPWISVVPQVGLGYLNEVPIEPSPIQLLAADKNKYQFYEFKANLRMGASYLYLNSEYFYQKSFMDKILEEPFFNNRANLLSITFFAAIFSDFVFTAKTAYDTRPGYDKEENRWSDLVINADWMINFFNFNDSVRIKLYDKYRLVFSRLHWIFKYDYILRTREQGFLENALVYETGNFPFYPINRVRALNIGMRWLHMYNNSLQDRFYLVWKFHAELLEQWTVEVGGNSVIEEVQKSRNNGQTIIDNLQGINFYKPQSLDQAAFRIEAFYLNIIHDLHCWELILGWNIAHQLNPFGAKLNNQLSYYEHVFYFAFRNKEVTSVGIPKTEAYRFKPNPDKYN